MTHLFCPYLNDQVELSEDREWPIVERHPELAPLLRQWIAATLEDPDGIRRSARLNNAWLFSRWHPGLLAGKHMVVVVVSDRSPAQRYWIITAYAARRLAGGGLEWRRG
jgi:hypothetical protein